MGIKNLRAQLPLLQQLKKSKAKRRKQILESGGEPLLKCVCECCYNVLKGNVRMQPATRRKLKKHAKKIRLIADRKVSLKTKKKHLVQNGGFLPALLVPILSVVSGLVGGLMRG